MTANKWTVEGLHLSPFAHDYAATALAPDPTSLDVFVTLRGVR